MVSKVLSERLASKSWFRLAYLVSQGLARKPNFLEHASLALCLAWSKHLLLGAGCVGGDWDASSL
jgi:hypothetical protein